MWVIIGGVAIGVLITAITMMTIWVYSNVGGDDGEEDREER